MAGAPRLWENMRNVTTADGCGDGEGRMGTIAVIVTKGFDEDRYLQAVKPFLLARHRIANLRPDSENRISGRRQWFALAPTVPFSSVTVSDYDAVVITEQRMMLRLQQEAEGRELLCRFADNGRPIFTACLNPRLFIPRGVAPDSHPQLLARLQQRLRVRGHQPLPVDRVESGALFSGRDPDDLFDFIQEALN